MDFSLPKMSTLFSLLFGLFFTQGSALPLAISQTDSALIVPQFVLDYAPLVWLDSDEQFFPTDLALFINNVHPTINNTDLANPPSPLSLSNLADLNVNGGDVYLSSNDDFTTTPQWLRGIAPDSNGQAGNTFSCAIVVHDRGQGIVDAFYFYFYGYNQGNTVLFNELGDHLGDWEHTMVRFQNGQPDTVWLSIHSFGEAFQYSALEKQGNRAIVYSAKGSHANYATSGSHDHTIPGLPLEYGPLQDVTSQGKLWDPVKNSGLFTVAFPDGASPDDSSNPNFAPYEDGVPSDWLLYIGKWGNLQLSNGDPKQNSFLGFEKFVSGPTGPRDKDLNRSQTCPSGGLCVVQVTLPPGSL